MNYSTRLFSLFFLTVLLFSHGAVGSVTPCATLCATAMGGTGKFVGTAPFCGASCNDCPSNTVLCYNNYPDGAGCSGATNKACCCWY